ncbi:MAG: ABC transporter ATP-binding protein, partial [Anaerolineales bacterium]
DTPILILDEPSTGLDAESTDLVLQALRKLMKGKTTIIISHELSLIRHADKIIVIKEGQIEQMGTHDELIRAGGLYANLYIMQSGQREMVESASPVAEIAKPPDGKGS